jgi:hypothetical protein
VAEGSGSDKESGRGHVRRTGVSNRRDLAGLSDPHGRFRKLLCLTHRIVRSGCSRRGVRLCRGQPREMIRYIALQRGAEDPSTPAVQATETPVTGVTE